MSSSLSSLNDNLPGGLQNKQISRSNLEYMTINNGLLICVDCNKNYEKEFEKDLTKRFENAYRFCDGDLKNLSAFLKRCFSI